MSNKISLNPSVLRDQSKQLDNLAKSYEGFYQKVEAEFSSINENWGSDLVANFVDKITKFKSTETELIEALRLAAKKAETSAYMFEHADTYHPSNDVAAVSDQQVNEINDIVNNMIVVSGKKYRALKTHMNSSMSQQSYSKFNQPYGYNAGCCAVAYAIGLSIVTGKSYDPTKYWRNGTTYYDDGHVGGWQNYNANIVVENINGRGKPTMINIQYDYKDKNGVVHHDGTHWVTAVGVSDGAQSGNITQADILVIDPWDGKTKSLSDVTSSSYYTNARLNGMKVFN